MHPVLFRLGSLQIDTYSVLWFLALSLAILWSVRRFPLYGVDDGAGRHVIGWSFLWMLFGARAMEYLRNASDYIADPSLFLDLKHGELSEVGAFLGAFLAALVLCRRNPKAPFQSLCGVVALPAALTMLVGRWGCFFNGCCVGIASKCALALHFPRDPIGVARHPTQLYYSAAAAAMLLVLYLVERTLIRRVLSRGEDLRESAGARGGAVTSIGLMLYAAMRLSVDVVRADAPADGLSPSHWILLGALPLELVWLWRSLRVLKQDDRRA